MAAVKKNLILEAAEKCFAEKGFRATSVQDIASQLDMAKGSLYFYFKSKEEMLLEILKKLGDEFLAILEAEEDPGDRSPRGILVDQIRKRLEFADSHQKLFPLFIRDGFEVTEEIFQLLSAMHSQNLLLNRRLILNLYGEKIRPYSFDAATVLISLCDSYIHASKLYSGATDFREVAEGLADRLNDLVQGMLTRSKPPLLAEETVLKALQQGSWCSVPAGSKPLGEIGWMREQLQNGPDRAKLEERLSILDALEAELAANEPKPVVLKGLIGLLRGIRIPGWKRHVQELESLLLTRSEET